jgi:hypothetical protein
MLAINSPAQAQAVQPGDVFRPILEFGVWAIEQERLRKELERQQLYQQIQPGGLMRSQVVIVQQILAQRGYDVGEADGLVGPKTMAVVAKLQQMAGVPITGLPDQQLLEALVQGQ